MFILAIFTLLGLATIQVWGQAIPAIANSAQLATVVGQYDDSGFDTPVGPFVDSVRGASLNLIAQIGNSLAFNIQLQPQALLTVSYHGTIVSNGGPLTQARA